MALWLEKSFKKFYGRYLLRNSMTDIKILLRNTRGQSRKLIHSQDNGIIGSKARLSRLENDLYISEEGESIYRSPYHKSLVFVIDESIDWEDHINAVTQKQIVVFWCFDLLDHTYHLKFYKPCIDL